MTFQSIIRHSVEGNEVVTAVVTIDTAKHLAMVSRSKKAFEIRNYFIEVEKRYRDSSLHSEFGKEKIELEMIGLETAIRILKVNEASKILMTKKLYGKLGLETLYLPEYSDEQHTYSLSALLKKFDVKISAKKLNQLLISKGFLEVKTRKSTNEFEDEEGEKVKIRTFKSLTKKGLEFGKNLISPHNQLETQPHYFESRFRDMLGVLAIF